MSADIRNNILWVRIPLVCIVHAGMVELVDTLALGASVSNGMWVRVPLSVQNLDK